ncbi:MAG TPA: mechanosensitive ion channel domain-containing protein [Candidatus Limnocylindrales bacterium]|nr:mechanosensitive ion channel domain-containing protein [Candidatus Limnocylindrales bacterium]
MAHSISSVKRFVTYLAVILVLTVLVVYIFHQFIAQPISLSNLIRQSVEIIISVAAWLAVVLIIRRFKPFMTQEVGVQASRLLYYTMLMISVLVIAFVVLYILKVPATDLLASAGIISVTSGLIISTFVGSLLSGFLVFTTFELKEGDNVIFNNIPGKVTEMTALVMRIETDLGQVTVPNSAIASGGIIVTAIGQYQPIKGSRLPYYVGDRVITSYMNEQGIVKDITALQTVIHLDSGKEITFLNSSVLSGGVAIAKITQPLSPNETKNAQS